MKECYVQGQRQTFWISGENWIEIKNDQKFLKKIIIRVPFNFSVTDSVFTQKLNNNFNSHILTNHKDRSEWKS